MWQPLTRQKAKSCIPTSDQLVGLRDLGTATGQEIGKPRVPAELHAVNNYTCKDLSQCTSIQYNYIYDNNTH